MSNKHNLTQAQVAEIEALTSFQLKAIRRNIQICEPNDEQTREAVAQYVADGGRMGEDQFAILLACEDGIRLAAPLGASLPEIRQRIYEICTGRSHWHIPHMAEAIYSAAGLPDAVAFQAGRIGIHTETERRDAGEWGTQYVTVTR